MKCFNTKLTGAMVALALVAFAPLTSALDPTVVTFDNGQQGWTAGPDCQTIQQGGPDGAYWNFVNQDCNNTYYLRAYFKTWNDTDPAFIGDYSAKGPVRISVDVNVNVYDFYGFFGIIPAETSRVLVAEFIDYDHQYVDPDTGYDWPWTSVSFVMDNFQDRGDGWKTFTVDIQNPMSSTLPEGGGWFGFGGPEDPNTYVQQLPPDYSFADVMAGVDEIAFHSIEPGWFYSIGFIHDMDFDNITIRELPRSCAGQDATIWVDNDGIIRGGHQDGQLYTGELNGTSGDDVIVGTNGDDVITAHQGNDVICGWDGNDEINGQQGNDIIRGDGGDDNLIGQLGDDYIDGGSGYDHINGGPGSNMCGHGENVQNCGASGGRSNRANQRQFEDRRNLLEERVVDGRRIVGKQRVD